MSNVYRLPLVGQPRTRAECLPGGRNTRRPCVYSSCSYNSATLATSRATPKQGICILDMSEEPHTLEEVGEVLGVGREMVRQIEEAAFAKLRKRGVTRGLLELLRSHDFGDPAHPLVRVEES